MFFSVALITGCMLGFEYVEEESVNHIVVDLFFFRLLFTF